jgi:periplasmic copper chaperone A
VKRIVISLLLSVAFAPTAAFAHSHKKGALEIVHPWTAETADSATVNIPVYMTIKNQSRSLDRLLGASSAIAEKVELIEVKPEGAHNLPVVTSMFRIYAGKSLDLTPAGPRLLLLRIKKRLHAYDNFPMTLVFERAGKVEVEVMVEEAATIEPHKH